jgi:hypothetical protein
MTFSNKEQKWVKKGQVLSECWLKNNGFSHAQCPFVLEKLDGKFQVYFSSRDIDGRSLPFSKTLSFDSQTKCQGVNKVPLLQLGKLGTFDDSGVMPAWLVRHDELVYMYYTGWNARSTIPYHNAIGMAVSHDDGQSFQRLSDGPLWDRDIKEPYFSACPCVMKDSDGAWRMWYLSCIGWYKYKGKAEPKYHLKYAESEDGINWQRNGLVSVDFNRDDEMGIVRASVLKQNGLFRMWYCYRYLQDYRTDIRFSYRIGYAESSDGITFDRQDGCVDLKLSDKGWDSQMLCYPHIFKREGRVGMLYNGNGFGKTGIGYAEL